MKFSIIVPVYNVEQYLRNCLDSIISQTYQNFELLVINDGSQDKSQEIINEYVKKFPKKIISFIKENGGLSDARNYGIQKAQGEYVLFVDSDDYINPNLLEELYTVIQNNNSDIIGYNIVSLNFLNQKRITTKKPECKNIKGEDAITKLVLSKQYFEPACGFAYKLNYWKSNQFYFMKGIFHEDFALIPLVILKAPKVTFMDFDGYYYIQTPNSITRTTDDEKEKKCAYDLLIGYDFLCEEIEKTSFQNIHAKKLLLSYISNSVICRLENIRPVLKKDYRKELKARKISNNIMSNTLKRKIRKILIRIKNRI